MTFTLAPTSYCACHLGETTTDADNNGYCIYSRVGFIRSYLHPLLSFIT